MVNFVSTFNLPILIKKNGVLLDRIIATNGIKAPNPPLTIGIFGYVVQIGESYFPQNGEN